MRRHAANAAAGAFRIVRQFARFLQASSRARKRRLRWIKAIIQTKPDQGGETMAPRKSTRKSSHPAAGRMLPIVRKRLNNAPRTARANGLIM
jgi:hypothetical protein